MKYWFFVFFLVFPFFHGFTQPVNRADTSLIPADLLGPKIWAIAPHSVINIRRHPGYTNEMTTQVLLGTPIKILAKKSNWYLVQTPEGYEGWTSAPLTRLDSTELHQFNKEPRVIVTDNSTLVYTEPKTTSEIVAETVMGNMLRLDSDPKKKGFYKVLFPDGRKGYIPIKSVKTWNDWRKSIQLTGSSIEQVARKFIGTPYFWGGASSRGLDCSGLTKTTYLMHGIILPRDARQQYLTGASIDSAGHFTKLQKGDLMFFGAKYPTDTTRYNIVHTAIYLQKEQFIQAGDGFVYISSLNPADKNFDAHNLRRYVVAKRILNIPNNGTWSIFNHPWYQ